ncbi:MAG: SCO family protein [Acidiferrobacterales bacterium]
MMRLNSRSTRPRRWTALVPALILVLIAACSRTKSWSLDDISGIVPALKFNLTNDSGQAVDASTYRGKVVLLYFGYTHCPDVCPTTLAKLGQAIQGLGTQAGKVRVLFVTVDPARDTTAALHRYVRAFGPEFVGLRGSNDALEKLAKRYRVVYVHEKPNAQGSYTVSHSSAVFIFDARGKARLLATNSDTAAAIGHDLRRLLNGR